VIVSLIFISDAPEYDWSAEDLAAHYYDTTRDYNVVFAIFNGHTHGFTAEGEETPLGRTANRVLTLRWNRQTTDPDDFAAPRRFHNGQPVATESRSALHRDRRPTAGTDRIKLHVRSLRGPKTTGKRPGGRRFGEQSEFRVTGR